MIYSLYKKQVEAFNKMWAKDDVPRLRNYALLSRHKDTIELLEAEIERKKVLRKRPKPTNDVPFDWGVETPEEEYRRKGYNSAIGEDIAYLESQLTLLKNER